MEFFLDKIKRKFKETKYKNFFQYFYRTWMGVKIPKSLWNFSDILEKNENRKFFHFTNNLTENINRYLNSKLRRAVCSIFLFREIILDIIIQFQIKTSNDIMKNKKSEILMFYIDNFINSNNYELLNVTKFRKLKVLYDEIEFININRKYNDDEDGEIDILLTDEDD